MTNRVYAYIHMEDASTVSLRTINGQVCMDLIECSVFLPRASLLVMRDLINEYLERTPA